MNDLANRSYYYDRIEAQFNIRADSTIQAEERITFSFTGNFHSAWRHITLDKISAITEVVVLDGHTLLPLKFSAKRLDKLAPDSWGYYTTWRDGGQQNIEWYYNLTDTKHTWILRYLVHGAIAFSEVQGRLYWDIFTDYDVPVMAVQATVILPQPVSADQVVAVAYTTAKPRLPGSYDAAIGQASFAANNFAPGDDFTIDVGFPAGLVSQVAFWRDWLGLFWGYLAVILIVLLTIIIIALRWYLTEKKPKGRGTIIPQYEPPQKLKPALAEIICRERLTNKGLTATVVDLAIRGYLKIEEDFGNNWLMKLAGKHYRLRQQRHQTDSDLEDYESKYLTILFGSGNAFSTREIKRWPEAKKRALHKSIQELKRDILIEAEHDTDAYTTSPSRENKAYTVGFIALVIIIGLGLIIPISSNFGVKQYHLALTAVVAAAAIIWLFFKFEARLSAQGRILKEDWLGFKMFLETAERYRLQNLTPETFAKFLPYAMIFGIEKKWARAFENMHLPEPTWYAGAAGVSLGNGPGSGFSASTFSANFSSSFTSAFGTSGGGSAGGGGAGGGGGGGGGGAG